MSSAVSINRSISTAPYAPAPANRDCPVEAAHDFCPVLRQYDQIPGLTCASPCRAAADHVKVVRGFDDAPDDQWSAPEHGVVADRELEGTQQSEEVVCTCVCPRIVGTRRWVGRRSSGVGGVSWSGLPRPVPLDLEHDAPTEEGSDDNQEAEHGGVVEGGLDCDGLDDVGRRSGDPGRRAVPRPMYILNGVNALVQLDPIRSRIDPTTAARRLRRRSPGRRRSRSTGQAFRRSRNRRWRSYSRTQASRATLSLAVRCSARVRPHVISRSWRRGEPPPEWTRRPSRRPPGCHS